MHSVDCPHPQQDLIFDLGDPVRWEYMLLGTDKSQLSLTEEDDSGINDEDDVENLVSLSSSRTKGMCVKASGSLTSVPSSVCVAVGDGPRRPMIRSSKQEGLGNSLILQMGTLRPRKASNLSRTSQWVREGTGLEVRSSAPHIIHLVQELPCSFRKMPLASLGNIMGPCLYKKI